MQDKHSVREFGFCAERDLHDGCPYYALAPAGPSATAATVRTTAGPDSSSKAESVFIRNRRVEKWASGRWFTS